MSIKTYEIHNSYLQDAPDSTGITRMVSEEDYLSQLQQTDALQTSLNNIINAFGISGEGAHSKLVIEYVSGLVAENEALKERNRNNLKFIAEELGDPEFRAESVRTPNTNAFTAELRAQGVDEYANATIAIGEDERNLDIIYAGNQAKLFAANLRAGRKG